MRFTQRDGTVYLLLTDLPGRRTFTLRDLDATGVEGVRLVGSRARVDWALRGTAPEVTLPDRLPVSAAHVLAVSGSIRPLV